MRLGNHPVPFFQIVLGEAEFVEILDQHFGIENPHDEFFAEGGRHGRQAQFDFAAVGFDGLDAAVLRAALFDHIHAAQYLDAAGHRRHDRRRNLINGVQHAVDAEAHIAGFAARFKVDVAGALVKGVIEQPVADVDDMLVVGVELAALAKLHQLFKIRNLAVGALVLLGGAADRFRQIEELDDVILDVERVGNHALDVQPQDLLERGFPVAHKRFAGGDRNFARVHADRQDAVALRVGGRHQLGDRAEIDFERVDMLVGHADLAGHPLGQRFEVQQFARAARILEFLFVEHYQRVMFAAVDATVGEQAFGVFLADQAVGDQITQYGIEGYAASRRDSGQPGTR